MFIKMLEVVTVHGKPNAFNLVWKLLRKMLVIF